MTVSSETRSVSYADASVGTFPVTFSFYDEAELVVTHTDTFDEVAVLVLNDDYTVSGGEGSTGTVVLEDEIEGTILIERVVPYTQSLQLSTQGPFPAKSIERELDRGVMRLQQMRDERADADEALDDLEASLTALEGELASETTARTTADTGLQTNITAEATARAAAVTAEAASRVSGDAATLASAVSADSALQTSLLAVIAQTHSGTATVTNGNTSVAVTFSTAEPNTNYRIALTTNAARQPYWSSKATGGFTINLASASAGNTLVDWVVHR